MHLYDFLNENDDTQSKIEQLINNKDWEKLFNAIKPINNGSSIKGFNIDDQYIPFKNNDGRISNEFSNFAKKIRSICNNNISPLLQYVKKVSNDKVKNFINQTLLPALNDPDSISNKGKNNNLNNIPSPEYYSDVAKALVYRSRWFVSKLADSKTQINPKDFNQLMIDAFNQGEKENFLNSFTNIDQKMSLDAAKQVVYQTKHNGDAVEQLGGDSNENESYYENIHHNSALLVEDQVNLPRRLSDFSDKLPIAMKQVDAVKHAWPQQYKTWYDKYQTKFEEGLKEGQDDVRDQSKKELKDPLTGKVLPGRKTLGSGGPNAWLKDFKEKNPTCGKWIDEIKNDKWTIFNMGPKLMFKLFDAIEKGGKILQDFCDGIADGVKDIKNAFKSGTSTKIFNKQIEEFMSSGDYGSALAVAKASATVEFTQLLELLQNGPIGTVNLEDKTFSTAMSNSQTSIEVAVQNLLAALDKYTDTEKRFEENKDVKINDAQTDSVLNTDNSDNTEKKSEETKNSNDGDDDREDGDDSDNLLGSSFKPTLKNFVINEETSNENDESQGEKTDSNSDPDDESKTGITQEKSENTTLNELEMIKTNFDETIDKNRLKEVKETLEKFKGEEGDVIRNKNGEASDFTNLDKIIELYKLLSEDDLKFNLNAASLKDFLDGIKKYIEDFKEIPEIKNLAIKIDKKTTKFPAMDAEGELTTTISGEEKAAELSKKIKDQQQKLIKSKIDSINEYAKSCNDDSWLDAYEKTVKSLDGAVEILRKELETVYETVPDWFNEYFNEFKTKNYLTKLYMLMSCMTNITEQLDKHAKKEDHGPDSEENNESIKPKILIRSLYLNENNDSPERLGQGKGNPTAKEKNQEPARNGGKQEPVKHNIQELFSRLEKINIHDSFLPSDPNAEIYTSNDPKKFTDRQREFALRSTGLSIASPKDGNGIAAILRHMLSELKNQGQKNNDILKQNNCVKLAAIFGADASQHTDRYNEDLFALLAAAWGCAKCLKKNLSTSEQNLDTKREDSNNDSSNQQTNDDSNNQSVDQNKEQNSNNQQQEDNKQENYSGNYPNVSTDSFLNEIYKYIRG